MPFELNDRFQPPRLAVVAADATSPHLGNITAHMGASMSGEYIPVWATNLAESLHEAEDKGAETVLCPVPWLRDQVDLEEQRRADLRHDIAGPLGTVMSVLSLCRERFDQKSPEDIKTYLKRAEDELAELQQRLKELAPSLLVD